MDGAPKKLGSYLLGQRIGVGGMAEIRSALRAGPGGFGKPMALKLLHPQYTHDQNVVRMFLDEARIAALIDHPGVVQVFDLGCGDGRYFIAMELVRGVSLAVLADALRARGEKIPAAVVSYIGREICDALHYAHELRDREGRPLSLVHRDVTPHNVLLSIDGRVKLADFGIAKSRDATSRTRKGTLKGTLEFVAPEQLAGKPLDRRVDVYGVALTLYTAGTLSSPFWRGDADTTLRAIRHESLPDLSELRPDLPLTLVAAVMRGAQKDPERRFGTAQAFRDALPPADDSAREQLGALVATVYDEASTVPPEVPFEPEPLTEPTTRLMRPLGRDELPTMALRVPTPQPDDSRAIEVTPSDIVGVPSEIVPAMRRRRSRPLWGTALAAALVLSVVPIDRERGPIVAGATPCGPVATFAPPVAAPVIESGPTCLEPPRRSVKKAVGKKKGPRDVIASKRTVRRRG